MGESVIDSLTTIVQALAKLAKVVGTNLSVKRKAPWAGLPCNFSANEVDVIDSLAGLDSQRR